MMKTARKTICCLENDGGGGTMMGTMMIIFLVSFGIVSPSHMFVYGFQMGSSSISSSGCARTNRRRVASTTTAPPPSSSSSLHYYFQKRSQRSPSSPSWLTTTMRPSRRQQRPPVYEEEEDDYYNNYYDEEQDDEEDGYYATSRRPRRPGNQTPMYEEGDETEEYENDDDYYRTTTTTTTEETAERRGGIYKVQFEPPSTTQTATKLDWEAVLDEETGKKTVAWVILPPEDVVRPNAILHFVGGTFFGSLPQIYYRTLLESLVRNTSCAIVVTPIPVTVLKSPLQHVSLGRKLQEALNLAWKVVLQDEYGSKTLSDVPLCGMGHSLGARLLMVLTTLNQNKPPKAGATVVVPPYEAFILMSFTNYGAAAGIPGIATLLQQSKQQEGKRRLQQTTKRRQQARKVNQEWWLDQEYNEDNDDEALDEEWQELVSELQTLVSEQASRVQQALTPNSKDLEFVPSPDQLWKAVQVDDRYKIPKTLLVQFDNDTIDQSAKLAQALQQETTTTTSNGEIPSDETPTTTTSSSPQSLHFCRLRGEHLSPISVVNDDGSTNDDEDGTLSSWWKLSTSTTRAIWKSIQGRSQTNRQETVLRELRQSLSSYILDVVTQKD